MIRVQGTDPTQLLRRMHHHGAPLIPLAEELIAQMVFKLGADDKVHTISQRRNGANSFALFHADGREFHFRGNVATLTIDVLDRARLGNSLAVLTDHRSVHQWVATL